MQQPRAIKSVVRPRTRLRVAIVLTLLVTLSLLLVTLSGCSDLTGATSAEASATSTSVGAFEQAEGEIFLEPAGTAGPESFTGETFVAASPPTSLNLPTTSTSPTTATVVSLTTTTAAATETTQAPATTATTAAGIQVASITGDTPALYGGSKNKTLVDKEGQLTFLENNPDKAAAFCAALNADPTFKWSGGDQIDPSQLRDYFAGLTPLMLTRDTRVTNHGYRDGKPTPRQSVLQAGQMVLVDQYGIPRVRCECGNPLAPPIAVKKTPKYTGAKWPGFDPSTVIVIQQTTVIINIFVVIDVETGEEFERPTGTDGAEDSDYEGGEMEDAGSAWNIEVTVTQEVSESGFSGIATLSWSGIVMLDPYPTIAGTCDGSAQAHISYAGETATADWVNGIVALSGELTSDGVSDTLHINASPSGFSVVNASIPESWDASWWLTFDEIFAEAFPSIDATVDHLQPVVVNLSSGPWTGTATFTPYEP